MKKILEAIDSCSCSAKVKGNSIHSFHYLLKVLLVSCFLPLLICSIYNVTFCCWNFNIGIYKCCINKNENHNILIFLISMNAICMYLWHYSVSRNCVKENRTVFLFVSINITMLWIYIHLCSAPWVRSICRIGLFFTKRVGQMLLV